MWNTLGVIDACSPSDAFLSETRHTSLATRRLSGKPLLEWLVRRISLAESLDRVTVLLPDTQASRKVGDLLPSDVSIYFGGQSDPLARMAGVVDDFEADSVVRVRLETPFVDPVLIDALIRTASRNSACDYISYSHRNGRPAIRSSIGLFAEWCKGEALLRAHREATNAADRQHPTRFLYSHPEFFALRFMPAPVALERDDLRLTIQSQEDWDNILQIVEALPPDQLDWQGISGLLEQQPAIRKRMAALNQTEFTN